ncbi:hypothetical protein [Roseobacter sp. CCS2]|uniref:hypothetical protein n=1 Tax=Roseobacter sp. CCS2 TaxID=391593 RepID=UPI0000F401DF|nr:hypothetical protein [Roseobacter sp. CCS2]EBA13768.1 hypothetical protein RCCS2_07764 [Roseobacter sp. CCS2]
MRVLTEAAVDYQLPVSRFSPNSLPTLFCPFKKEHLLKNWPLIACAAIISVGGLLGIAYAQDDLDNPRITQQTQDYVQLRQNGELSQAWDMWVDGRKLAIPFDRFTAIYDDLNSRLGDLIEFEVLRVVQDEDPTIFLAHFSAAYSNDYFECGYFIWQDEANDLRLVSLQRVQLSFATIQGEGGYDRLVLAGCTALPDTLYDNAGQ